MEGNFPLGLSLIEVRENIFKLMKLQLGILYYNCCLEGPKDVPTFMEAYACYYPTKNFPYFSFGDEKSLFLEQKPKEIRDKILEYSLRDEMFEIQRELITDWEKLGEIAKEVILALHTKNAEEFGIPLTFIAFGRTKEGDFSTAYIFHPPDLPTFVCLESLQKAVKEANINNN